MPPERYVCPVNLRREEEVVLGLRPALLLHEALPQVLVDVVAQRALDLLAPLARGEHGALRDLDEHLPRRRLLVLHHQLEARVVEVQQPGLLRLARLNLDLRRDDISRMGQISSYGYLFIVRVRLTAGLVEGTDF